MEERRGVLTPNQEKGVVELSKLEGIKKTAAKVAVQLGDNQVIERLKKKIPVENHETVYAIVDEILSAFGIEK